MKNKLIVCSYALLTALALAGCGEDSSMPGDSGPAEASLTADVMPIFDAQCSGCHAREGSPFPDAVVNGVYYETKEDILGNIGMFIVPGDSANSGLVGVMARDFPVGTTPTLMPPPDVSTDGVPASDVALFARWIDEGAQDN